MLLSDKTIKEEIAKGGIVLEPYDEKLVEPCSVDVRLGYSFRIFENHTIDAIDMKDPPKNFTSETVITKDEYFIIHPGEFILAETLEKVTVGDDIAAFVEGKSSIGRLGLVIETAGVVDSGFSGTITLELSNLTRVPIRLHPELPIAQLCFQRLSTPSELPYGHPERGSHYQGQTGATPSRFGE